jgi:holin-like protein
VLSPLAGFTALLLCQLAGELLVRAAGAPVPGPVAGMLILLAALGVRGRRPAGIEEVADRLLANLSLLFVPAGVGISQYFGLIADEWEAIVVALLGSTLVTVAITALLAAATLPPEREG